MAALKETEYVETGRQLIFRESAWMKEKMTQLGLKVYPSEANYIFFRGPEDLGKQLLTEGFLVRDCSNYPGLTKGYYRIAVRLRPENEALVQAMKQLLDQRNT